MAVVDDGREPAARGVERDARAVLARQLGGRRGQRRDRDQSRRPPVRAASRRAGAQLDAAQALAARAPTTAVAPRTSTRSTSTPAPPAPGQRRAPSAPRPGSRPVLGGDGPDAPAESQPAAARAPRSRRDDRCRRRAGSDRRRPSRTACAGRVTRTRPARSPPPARPGGRRRPRPPGKKPIAVAFDTSRTPAARGLVGQRARPRAAARLRVQRAARLGLLVVERDARARAPARAISRAAASPAGPPPIDAGVDAPRPSSSVGARRVASGSVPEPPISRTILRNSAFPGRLPVINVWWSMPRGKQPVGRREQIDVGAGEGVLPLAGAARRAPAPCRRAGWAARRCAWCRRRSARRGRTGRAAGGTWSTGRACGCRRRTAPRPPARPRTPARGSPSKSIVTISPEASARPAKPRRVLFHAQHCIKVWTDALTRLGFGSLLACREGPVLVDDDLL